MLLLKQKIDGKEKEMGSRGGAEPAEKNFVS